MPLWRYVANRGLTLIGNLLLGAKLSEYHTGYRAFSRSILEQLPLDQNSDDFVFDNQMLAQVIWTGFTVAEVSCPTRYATDASSINFARSVRYGFGCIGTAIEFAAARAGSFVPSLPAARRAPGRAATRSAAPRRRSRGRREAAGVGGKPGARGSRAAGFLAACRRVVTFIATIPARQRFHQLTTNSTSPRIPCWRTRRL
jgi:hypothetical protein